MADAGTYVFGHGDREVRWLAQQAGMLNPLTEGLLRRARLSPGMSVLDLGSGLGDVSLLAARLVGPSGRVIGIDSAPKALEIATERARAEGQANVTFVEATLETFRPAGPIDAIIGRHILIHVPDPAAVLRRAANLLGPGGIVAFQEYDFAAFVPSYPATPLWDQVRRAYLEFFTAATRPDMGMRLCAQLIAAGFPTPDCRIETPIQAGSEAPLPEVGAEAYRSMLPRAAALGLKLGLDPDGLAERLRAELIATGAGAAWPLMVSAFAVKP